MSVCAGVPRCTGQALAVSVRNMGTVLAHSELLSKPEIYAIYLRKMFVIIKYY